MKLKLAILTLPLLMIIWSAQGTQPEKIKSNPQNPLIFFSVDQIYEVPGLADAITQDQSRLFLQKDQQYYTIEFPWMGYIFRITGTYQQWTDFFSPVWLRPATKQSGNRID